MSARFVRLAAAFGAAVLLLGACGIFGSDECAGASCAAPRSTASPATTEWRRIVDLPSPARQEVASAVVGVRVYIVGGLIAGGGATDAVHVYESDTWTEAQPLPIKVHHAMAAEHDGELVVIGGFLENGAATGRVFIFGGGGWREGPTLRRPRAAGGAVSIGGEVVVVGGVAGGKHVAPVEIFDGTSWKDGASIPSPRDHLGAATDGTLVYVVGGRRGGNHFGTFDVYDPVADEWSSLPDMPTARSGNGAAFVGGKIVAVGGEGPRIFPEVEAYDVTRRRWTRLPDLVVPVHGVGVAAVGSNVYAFVGGLKVGLGPTRACQVLAID